MNEPRNERNGRNDERNIRSRFDENDAPSNQWGREQQRGSWQESYEESPVDFGQHGEYRDPYREYEFQGSGRNRYSSPNSGSPEWGGQESERYNRGRGERGENERWGSERGGNQRWGSERGGSEGYSSSSRQQMSNRDYPESSANYRSERYGQNREGERGEYRDSRYDRYESDPSGSYYNYESRFSDRSGRGGYGSGNSSRGRMENQNRWDSGSQRYNNDFRGYGESERSGSSGSSGFGDSSRSSSPRSFGEYSQSGYGSQNSGSRGREEGGYERPWEEGPYSGRGPKGYSRSDDRIKEDICERLTYNSYIDPSDVQVSVNKGEVTLSGTIHGRRSKRLIEDAIESVRGVQDIRNELRVTENKNEGTQGSGNQSSMSSNASTSSSSTGGDSSSRNRTNKSTATTS